MAKRSATRGVHAFARHPARATKSSEDARRRGEKMRIEFEPFIDTEVRQFIVNGVDNYNIAATNLPEYFPVNFVLRGECGDLLGGVLGQLWGNWLQITYLWVAEAAR